MKRILLLAALLSSGLAGVFARAADPALVRATETYLRDDEKAMLAALLIHPDLSAEFDADAALAQRDPKNLGPFLGVWRGKMAAFAAADAQRGNPDLKAHYASVVQLMTPEQMAYTTRFLLTMDQKNRDSLTGYLESVENSLAKNGELTWYTRKVAAGILDAYRKYLNIYLATPLAQAAQRDAASSAAAFAAIRRADDARQAALAPAPAPAGGPDPSLASVTTPAPLPGQTTDAGRAGSALGQARSAAGAGQASGAVFDGGAGAGNAASGGAVVVPPGSGSASARPTLSAGKPGRPSGLAGSIPDVPPPPTQATFLASIKKPGSAPAALQRRVRNAGLLFGALLGAMIGFILGGPAGAAVGIAIGMGLGAAAGRLAAKRLLQ